MPSRHEQPSSATDLRPRRALALYAEIRLPEDQPLFFSPEPLHLRPLRRFTVIHH